MTASAPANVPPRSATPEERLQALGFAPPAAGPARGHDVAAARTHDGRQVHVAGQGPVVDGRVTCTGRVGAECTPADARAAARIAMLNVLAQLRAACGGTLSTVRRGLSATVHVSSAPGFFGQAEIADSATGILAAVWGPQRLPARTTVGVAALPADITVMIDAVFECEVVGDTAAAGGPGAAA